MMKTGTIACGVLFTALFVATTLEAQSSAPPSPPGFDLPKPALPSRDIQSEVDKMTKSYGLSGEKATVVKAILEEQTRKAEEVASNNSLAPEEKVHRLIGVKDEEITRVSDALTPEQKKKYMAEVRPAPPQPTGPPAQGTAAGAANQ